MVTVGNNYDNIGRNEPCPCGSGRKHKHCHLRILNEVEQFACMEKHAIERKKNELVRQSNPVDQGLIP